MRVVSSGSLSRDWRPNPPFILRQAQDERLPLCVYTVAPRHPTSPAIPPIPYHPRHTPPHPVIPAKAGIRTPAYRYAEVPPPGFWIPACAGMTVGNMSVSNIAYPQHPYAAPPRHSRESGNPHPGLPPRRAATGVLDSGLRWNGGGEISAIRHYLSATSIRRPTPSFPRKRESTPILPPRQAAAGILDSGLRRNDGGEYVGIQHCLHRNPHIPPPPSFPPHPVIPAKAEIHTPAHRIAGPPLPGFWIPACAGMTVGGANPRRQATPAYRGRWRQAIDD